MPFILRKARQNKPHKNAVDSGLCFFLSKNTIQADAEATRLVLRHTVMTVAADSDRILYYPLAAIYNMNTNGTRKLYFFIISIITHIHSPVNAAIPYFVKRKLNKYHRREHNDAAEDLGCRHTLILFKKAEVVSDIACRRG